MEALYQYVSTSPPRTPPLPQHNSKVAHQAFRSLIETSSDYPVQQQRCSHSSSGIIRVHSGGNEGVKVRSCRTRRAGVHRLLHLRHRRHRRHRGYQTVIMSSLGRTGSRDRALRRYGLWGSCDGWCLCWFWCQLVWGWCLCCGFRCGRCWEDEMCCGEESPESWRRVGVGVRVVVGWRDGVCTMA